MTVTVGSKNKLNSISGVVKILQLTDEEKELLAEKVLPSGLAITDSNGHFYLTDGETSIGNLIPVPSVIDENGDNIASTYLKIADAATTYQTAEDGKGLSTNDFTTEEKTKLKNIEENANKYELPVATASVLGGVTVPSTETHLSVDGNGALAVDVSDKLDTTGTAASATKLANARTISLAGDVYGEMAFDGSENKNLTVYINSSGVTAGSYGESATKTADYGETITITNITVNEKGAVTAAKDIVVTLPSAQTDITGNAGTATKLAATKNIGISGAVTGTAVAFDGSSDVTIETTSVDASKISGTVEKASKDGQGNTISTTYAKKADVYTKTEVDSKVAGAYHFKGSVDSVDDLPTTDVVEGDVYNIGNSLDGDNYVAHFNGETLEWDKLGGTVDLSAYLTKTDAAATYLTPAGNAASATKLASAKTISLGGDATGSTTFDGTANRTITVELASSGATAGSYGESADKTTAFSGTVVVPHVTVDAKGRVTSVEDVTVTLPAAPTSITGNAATASKLKDARTITISGSEISGDGVSFDGSANITLSAELNDTGVASGSYGETETKTASFGSTITVPHVTVSAKGRITNAEDVVITLPAAPTSVSGNAGTATKLATARTISIDGDGTGSASFDGSADKTITLTLASSGATAGTYGEASAKTASFGETISVPKVTVDAKGRVTSISSTTVIMPSAPTTISGNAATASKLKTAQDIGLSGDVTGSASFDGSAGVTIAATLTASGVTEGTYGESTDKTVEFGDAVSIPTVTVDEKGRVTSAGNTSITLPSAPTTITGNAGSATKLATARDIGLSGAVTGSASFDGSKAITIATTLADSGATAGTYGESTAKTADYSGTVTVPKVTVDAAGRVTSISDVTVTLPAAQTTVTGNAGSATKLETARTISLSGAATGTATSFDGSADIDISVTSIDGTKVSGIVPQASKDGKGNTISTTYATKSDTYTKTEVDNLVSGVYRYAGTVASEADLPTSGVRNGDVYNVGESLDGANYVANVDSEGNITWDKLGDTVDLSGYLTKTDAAATYLGKSDTAVAASKLATSKSISISGDATGSANFDGSSNVTIAATLAASGVTAGTYGEAEDKTASFGGTVSIPTVTVDAKGRVTGAASTTVTLPAAPTSVSGNAGTATKLATSRTISASGDATGSASFDGSADATIALTLAASGVTAGSYGETKDKSAAFGGTVSIPTVTVDAKGRVTSAASTTVTLPAAPTSVTGNAGTATKLATARTVSLTGDTTGSTSFDGSANVSITTALAASGVTAGSYGEASAATKAFGGTISVPRITVDAKGRVTSATNTTVTLPAAPTSVSGNAGTATKLQTARTIGLTGDATGSASFNGSANVSITTTLANSGVSAGTYGLTANSSTAFTSTASASFRVPKIVVDAKGRVTSAGTYTVTITRQNAVTDAEIESMGNTAMWAHGRCWNDSNWTPWQNRNKY